MAQKPKKGKGNGRRRRCQAKTKRGTRCQAAPLRGRKYCSAHDPDLPDSTRFGSKEQATRAGQLGGRPRNPRPHEVLRERIEADIDRWLKPIEDALEHGRPVVIWDARAGRHEIQMVADPALALKAMQIAFDRVYGRPRQQVELTGEDGGPVRLTDETFADPELRELMHDLVCRIADARAREPRGSGSGD